MPLDAAPETPHSTETVLSTKVVEVVSPPQITRLLIDNPDLRARLKSEGQAVVDIARPDNPAHAFEFATWNLSPEVRRKLRGEIIEHFNENPESGILFRARGDTIKGFLTSSSPEDLEKSMAKLSRLVDQLSEGCGDGGVALFVAELAELQVNISAMGKKDKADQHFAMISVSDAGLTYVNWAQRAVKAAGEQVSGKLFWVSTQRQEASRGKLRREHIVEGIPARDYIAEKSGVAFSVRSLTEKFKDLEVDQSEGSAGQDYFDKISSDFQQLPEEDQQEVLRVGVVGIPGGLLASGELSWAVKRITPEGIEMETNGVHVKFKLDFSGMSRLVGAGIDIGPTLKDVFSGLLEEADEDEKINNYMMQLEGDALVLYMMLPDLQSDEMMGHFLKIQEKLSQAFVQKAAKDLEKPELSKVLGEHNVGLKLYARVSEKPITLKLFKGGVGVIEDPEFNKWEESIESQAKKGGYVAGVVHDVALTDAQIEALYQGVHHKVITVTNPQNPSETINVYLIKQETLYETKFSRFVGSLAADLPGLHQDINLLGEQLHELAYHTSGEVDEQLSQFENNVITTAKILYMVDYLIARGIDQQVIVDKLLTCFSRETCRYITQIRTQGPESTELKALEVIKRNIALTSPQPQL